MLQEILEKKPYLAWDVTDKKTLSEQSCLEHILCYGDWEDVKESERIIGISRMKSLFEDLLRKRRVNLSPRTQNYFTKYFAKYA